MNFQPQLLALLEASLVRPLVLVAAAWLILRGFRIRHPASRHSVWTAVLAGMLVLPFLSVMTPDWTLAVLPAAPQPAVTPLTPLPLAAPPTSVVEAAAPVVSSAPPSVVRAAPYAWPSFDTVIVWGYVAGLLAMLTSRLTGWVLLRRVMSRSTSLRPLCLRESGDVVTPVAVGVLRPAVLLPAGWRAWSPHTRRAVFAHEFAHLRRRDTLVAALARLVTCVFWFHPAAWWVSRQTSDLAELACDVVALQRVGDPAGYSRVLVEFAAAVNGAGRRVALPGLAIASGSRMGDRIDEVFALSGGTMRRLARPGVWLAAIGLPALGLAATVVLSASTQVPASSQATRAADTPTFEVASIKPCANLSSRPAGSGRSAAPWSAQVSPGHLYWSCISLYELIHQAYAAPETPLLHNRVIGPNQGDPWLIQGAPEWILKDRFTVEVKVSGEVPRPDLSGAALGRFRLQAAGPALRAMLEDRFQLKLHRAMGERPMYLLSVARGGLKIKPATPGDCWEYAPRADGTIPLTASGRGGVEPPVKPADAGDRYRCGANLASPSPEPGVPRFEGGSITLADLALFLSRRMDRWVLDKTGRTGKYTFEMRYALDEHMNGRGVGFSQVFEEMTRGAAASSGRQPPASRPPADGPSIFEALSGLGLELAKGNGLAEHFVIDRVQRPTPDDRAPALAVTAGFRQGRTS